MQPEPHIRSVAAVLAVFGLIVFFSTAFLPAYRKDMPAVPFTVSSGEGVGLIAEHLKEAGLIRSVTGFKILAVGSGEASRLKPGTYTLDPNMRPRMILSALTEGTISDIEVRIPDGAAMHLVDKILSDKGVLKKGELLDFVKATSTKIEGTLYPDTYRFYPHSIAEEVVAKMQANFREKTRDILPSGREGDRVLVTASLIEKEVPEFEDRRIVAGIIAKRLAANMALQVDATVCYVKNMKRGEYVSCEPITASDLKLDSPYNTYLVRGLPPGPIGSPETEAIKAAMSPLSSPYWYYLSDPKTGKTIYARTLEEHAENRRKYLSL